MSIEKIEKGKIYFSVFDEYKEYICEETNGSLLLYIKDNKAHNELIDFVEINNSLLYEQNEESKRNALANLQYFKDNNQKINTAYSEATLEIEPKENRYKSDWFNSFDKEPKVFIQLLTKEIKRLKKMKKGKNRRIKKITEKEIKEISNQITTTYLSAKNEYLQKQKDLYLKVYFHQPIDDKQKEELEKIEKKYNEQKEIFQNHNEIKFSRYTAIIAIFISIISVVVNSFNPLEFITSRKSNNSLNNTELVSNVVSAINILNQYNLERMENVSTYVEKQNDSLQKAMNEQLSVTKKEILQTIDAKEKEFEVFLDENYVKKDFVESKQ